MRIITPKSETTIYPFEDYDRNKKIYEARVSGQSFNKIAINPELNPQGLTVGRLQEIYYAFKRRHTQEVKK